MMDVPDYLQQRVAENLTLENEVLEEQRRPSCLFQSSLRWSIDGNQWCCLMGTDLQAGIAGFGASPDAAAADFDRAWRTPLPSQTQRVK